jgi:hypothetical protein
MEGFGIGVYFPEILLQSGVFTEEMGDLGLDQGGGIILVELGENGGFRLPPVRLQTRHQGLGRIHMSPHGSGIDGVKPGSQEREIFFQVPGLAHPDP